MAGIPHVSRDDWNSLNTALRLIDQQITELFGQHGRPDFRQAGTAQAQADADEELPRFDQIVSTANFVQNTLTLTAGDGLVGGGDLSANRTFTVVGGTGITANANDIEITDTAVTPGSYTFSSITVDQQGRLTAASSGATPATRELDNLQNTQINADLIPDADNAWDLGSSANKFSELHTTGISSADDEVTFASNSRPDGAGTIALGSPRMEVGGIHTGATDSYTVTGISSFEGTPIQVGDTIQNTTDSSSGTITSINWSAKTITCSGGLAGGTYNDWRNNDNFKVRTDLQPFGFIGARGVIAVRGNGTVEFGTDGKSAMPGSGLYGVMFGYVKDGSAGEGRLRQGQFGAFASGHAEGGAAGSVGAIDAAGAGGFAFGMAKAVSGKSYIQPGGYGSFMFGRAGSRGSSGLAQIKGKGKGTFAGGATESYDYWGAGHTAQIYAEGAGTFCWGYVSFYYGPYTNNTDEIRAVDNGGFAVGFIDHLTGSSYYGGYDFTIKTHNKGGFAQGVVADGGQDYCSTNIKSDGLGAFAQGAITPDGASQTAFIQATNDGAFAQGRIVGGVNITASGKGSLAHGYAKTNSITASGQGSGAFGDSTTAAITASAQNAFQFGEGTNATSDSVQVGGNVMIKANGQLATNKASVTLGVGVTTFATTSNVMEITGDGGANTIATITGGVDGQLLTLIFVDGLVTITNDNTHAANSVDLSAAFTSADDSVLQIVFDGTSWYEISRSVN